MVKDNMKVYVSLSQSVVNSKQLFAISIYRIQDESNHRFIISGITYQATLFILEVMSILQNHEEYQSAAVRQ